MIRPEDCKDITLLYVEDDKQDIIRFYARNSSEIYIVENMGNNYQGFDWFKVEYNRGRNGFVSEAYAWGGTICAAGGPIPGIMQQCP